ncbi:glycosyltransferase family 2 protein [Bdellovibrio bacteriovorus]|uniref:glycosyltransferase family 2 protein n=1 Tax=Bdellovibrio bacteriovorus TaxID=959 RepID=UPI0035A6D249
MVSICIPTYENVVFLKRALDSAVVQEGVEFEIVISDDSRTTEVEQLVKQYSFPIRYFRNEKPIGSPGNWNAAVDRAESDIIHLLHHDDAYYSHDSLQRMLSPIKNGKKITFSECLWSPYQKINCYRRGATVDTFARLKQGFLGDLFAVNFLSVPSTMLYRRDQSVRYDESFINMVDVDFYLTMIRENGVEAVEMVEGPCVVVNIESDFQVTNSLVSEKLKREEWARFYQKWSPFLIEIGADPEQLYQKALIHQGLTK